MRARRGTAAVGLALLLAACGEGGNAFGGFGAAGGGAGAGGADAGSVSFAFSGDFDGGFVAAGAFPAADADSAGARSWATATATQGVAGVAARQDLGGGVGDQLRLTVSAAPGTYACGTADVLGGVCGFTATFALEQAWRRPTAPRALYALRGGTVVVEASTGQRLRGTFRLTMANALTGFPLEVTDGRFDVPLRPEGLPF